MVKRRDMAMRLMTRMRVSVDREGDSARDYLSANTLHSRRLLDATPCRTVRLDIAVARRALAGIAEPPS
jgi:hypothetical protein